MENILGIKENDIISVCSTEDEDLDEWLDEQGSREIRVTCIDNDEEGYAYLWGNSIKTGEECPYHIEIQEVIKL